MLDSLRFGRLDAPDTARLVPDVVAGLGGYANRVGVPTIGGEVTFGEPWAGECGVTTLCLGLIEPDDGTMRSPLPGDVVVVLGSKTDVDGIEAVAVLVPKAGSEPTARRAAGDTLLARLLVDCVAELGRAGIARHVINPGPAGLSRAVLDLANDVGVRVDLAAVPAREPVGSPEEVIGSRTPQRLLVVVGRDDLDRLSAVCAKWDVPAAPVGELVAGNRLQLMWASEMVADVFPGDLARPAPPARLPEGHARRAQPATHAPDRVAWPSTADELRRDVLAAMASSAVCDRSWITEQYDRFVGGQSVLAQPEDAGMVRVATSGIGIAATLDTNPRMGHLDPYLGAQLSVAEAFRNVAVTGAEPVAAVVGLPVGSETDERASWQVAETVAGLAEACRTLGVPVEAVDITMSGRLEPGESVPPPTVGVVGVIADVACRVRSGFLVAGDAIALLGATQVHLSGSLWAAVALGEVVGAPPTPDLALERRLAKLLAEASQRGILTSAHDVSDGGLAVTLAEACLLGGHGARIGVGPLDLAVALFSETPGRAVTSIAHARLPEFQRLADDADVPLTVLGEVTDDETLAVEGSFSIPLAEVRSVWTAPLRVPFADDVSAS